MFKANIIGDSKGDFLVIKARKINQKGWNTQQTSPN